MSVPSWIHDAVFYQIFPDRFANGDPSNDPPNVHAWGSPPTNWNFQGGDLRGIINHFDYLLDLGINAIYLNPIFQSTSNHRYNTQDYYRIDPKLGSPRDFHALLDVAHRNGVHIILDGVFNHSGRGFFAFVDLLENQERSPYRDWFYVQHFPIQAYGDGDSQDYLSWWNIRSLPKLNTANPSVRKYLFDIARYWIEQGADGWRLDVPNEIDDDSFWAEFRHVVKSVNPDAYLVGEIWTADPRWVGEGYFDGLMHYPWRDCLLRQFYAGTLDAGQCAERVMSFLKMYPRENHAGMYLPLGSHDTERILTKLEGDVAKMKLAVLFQFAYPGAPAIYYGDEIGMKGDKDPGCRGAFPWDESQWNQELRQWYKTLIDLRKRRAALRLGDCHQVCVDISQGCFAFARILEKECVLVALNASPSERQLSLPVADLGWQDGQVLHNLLGTDEYIVSQGAILVVLPPWSGAYIS
jgi:glycosidase